MLLKKRIFELYKYFYCNFRENPYSDGYKGVIMAKCEQCGKKPMSGNNVSFSQKKTKRRFKPNIQRVTVYEGGLPIRKKLCTRCIRTLAKV